jgi:hypothetical protein
VGVVAAPPAGEALAADAVVAAGQAMLPVISSAWRRIARRRLAILASCCSVTGVSSLVGDPKCQPSPSVPELGRAQGVARSVDVLADRSRPPVGQQAYKGAAQRGVRWAREELNLRPLPCQIQRASASLNDARLDTGKDHQKAAGERRYQRSGASTIRHASPAVLLVAMMIGCCPSAAR